MKNKVYIYSLISLVSLQTILFVLFLVFTFSHKSDGLISADIGSASIATLILDLVFQPVICSIAFWLFKSTKKTFYLTTLIFNLIFPLGSACGIIFVLVFLFSKKLKQDLQSVYNPSLLPFNEKSLKPVTLILWFILIVNIASFWLVPAFLDKYFLASFLLIILVVFNVFMIAVDISSKVRYFKANKTKVTKWFWIDLFLLSYWNHDKYSIE